MEKMELTFVNVGYGEAMLIRCPDPTRPSGQFVMVIDGGGGEAGEYAENQTGRVPMADWLADEGLDHIDVMAFTHIHEDHISGLPAVMERWRPGRLWQTLPAGFYKTMPAFAPFPGIDVSQDKFRRALNDYRAMCAQMDGRIETLTAGWRCRPCPELTVEALAPSRPRAAALEDAVRALCAGASEPDFPAKLSRLDGAMNNFSLILTLEYRGARILLPGDTNRAGYGDIDPAALRAEIFKVGHHGQIDGADEALLDAVRPRAVVCCASSDRRYNSAHPDTLALMEARGAKMWYSDCPVPVAPPHRALTFSIGGAGAIEARYHP